MPSPDRAQVKTLDAFLDRVIAAIATEAEADYHVVAQSAQRQDEPRMYERSFEIESDETAATIKVWGRIFKGALLVGVDDEICNLNLKPATVSTEANLAEVLELIGPCLAKRHRRLSFLDPSP
jgi:hypothetical protein